MSRAREPHDSATTFLVGLIGGVIIGILLVFVIWPGTLDVVL